MAKSNNEYTYEYLGRLLEVWRAGRKEPDAAGALSVAEWRALALAARHSLNDPIHDFLMLDGCLQAWVLRQLGVTSYIGSRIGVD